MDMQRPVVVAVDLCPRSRHAQGERYAAAVQANCGLVVVHVLSAPPLVAPRFSQSNAKHAVDGAELRLQALATMAELVDALPHGAAIDIQFKLREGDAAGEVLDLIGNVQARLLVLSSTGRELGPITLALIHGASCPVLAVAATRHIASAEAHER